MSTLRRFITKVFNTQHSETIDAARDFMETVWDAEPPTEAELAHVLDKLLAAYHNTPDCDFTDLYVEPPDRDWKEDWDKTAKRFPDFGFYAVADPLTLYEPPDLGVADAL